MADELKQIKKIYGEDMMHLCRELFPDILENEGKLLRILNNNIAPTRSFAKDVIDNNLKSSFRNWINSLLNEAEIELLDTNKTPFELMEEAGYTLYECKSEEDIQSFRHFYSREGRGETPIYIPGTKPTPHKGEELCTFSGDRLERCFVFFAIKKNVDEIKREDFYEPKREDEYGTSVISIQFSKDCANVLSIKNRYNHTVENPDATFGNNLENIIPGLTNSFEKYYGFDIEQCIEETGYFLQSDLNYVRAKDGKYYRYNLEMDNIYYCENNIIIKNGNIIRDYANNKERYLLVEQVVIDLKEKKAIFPCPTFLFKKDSFVESINNVGEIKNIEVVKKGDNRIINIKYDKDRIVKIEIDKNNAIIGYVNDHIKKIGDFFLPFNKKMKYISLNNCEKIGQDFLDYNKNLIELSLPTVKRIEKEFLNQNNSLLSLYLPEVEVIGSYFLRANTIINSLYLPKVKKIGDYVLNSNKGITILFLPEVEEIGYSFMCVNKELEGLYLPKVKKIGDCSFSKLEKIKDNLSLPEVEEIGNHVFEELIEVEDVNLPKLRVMGDAFLMYNDSLVFVTLPNAEYVGEKFLKFNTKLKYIDLPKVKRIKVGFLDNNEVLEYINIPKDVEIKKGFNIKPIHYIISDLLESNKTK